LLAQLEAAATRDHEIQHDDRRFSGLVQTLRLCSVEREDHLVALGSQQVLRQLRCEWISLREQHEHTAALIRRDIALTLSNALRQDAVSVRGARYRMHRP